MNIGNAIHEGAIRLKKKGVKSFNIDSEILMSKVLNQDRKYIILNLNQKINFKNLKYFMQLINKRSLREPIAYLTGKKEFWKYQFKITNDVLIPRPDTEIIIEEVLKFTKNKSKLKLLDIGIGSGCILLSILKREKFLWNWYRFK